MNSNLVFRIKLTFIPFKQNIEESEDSPVLLFDRTLYFLVIDIDSFVSFFYIPIFAYWDWII